MSNNCSSTCGVRVGAEASCRRRPGFGRTSLLAVVVAFAVFGPACTTTAVMRGKIEGLQKITEQAERNGAVRCAPRELALAKSHLHFATIELDQGFVSRASNHMVIAEPNANSALALSPPEVCAERGYYIDEIVPEVEEPEVDPDTDGDGILDSMDMCILEPEDKDGFLDEDGCPEPDNDLDGIPDAIDKCPNEPEDFDGFEDDDGCPDPDNDKDGVLDVDDICPNEPGPPGGDRPGCPVKPSLAIITGDEIRILQEIRFDFNKAVIKPESMPIVEAVADIMKAHQNIKIEVQGHTDNKGAAKLNKTLSDKRAKAVRDALINNGIDPSRLTAKGYGMERPIADNKTEQGRAKNRRVQFIRTESDSK